MDGLSARVRLRIEPGDIVTSAGKLFRALALGTLALCAGCATKFDPAAGAKVHTVALTGFDEPEYGALSYFVLNATTVVPRESFSAMMDRQNLHLGAELKVVLAQALRNDGYEVVDDAATADALLNVRITGFRTDYVIYASYLDLYEPEITVVAKLTDAHTHGTLFQQLYLYANNSIEPMDGSLLLRPDPKYSFRSVERLVEDPKLAADGLRAVEPMVAQSLQASLKKP